jgi:ribonuclease-3
MMLNKINDLEKIIKYTFKDSTLLSQALTHKSLNNDNNNEKLEFLGDRVLGLVISQKLLEKFPGEKEGLIDKKFANLVNKKTCLLIAKKIELKKYMTTGNSYKGLSRSDGKIIGDGLEALLGAIYLDQGITVVEKFILNLWDDFLDKSSITKIDAKTQLQEYSLKKYKILPIYKINKQSGPQHSPIFKVEVQIKSSKKYFASGNSKKDAQQNAAQKLLIDLKI